MNIGIIGAGFTGLAAAKKLIGTGHQVTVLERENLPGGLAAGFSVTGWEWPLERHYHHVFTTDRTFRALAAEIGIPLPFYRPVTSIYYSGTVRQLDSPLSLLQFSALGPADRLRTALGLVLLKFNPFWRMFDGLTAEKYIKAVMGRESWKILWEPLFVGKFGKYAGDISAAWFWARIVARSPHLGYPEGGFTNFAAKLSQFIEAKGGKLMFGRTATGIIREKSGIKISLEGRPDLYFDRVLCTLPFNVFTGITADLPETYVKNLNSRPGLGAVTLILSLREKFLPGIYWLNINDRTMPFISVVEHTNFIEKSHYQQNNLLYIGNYLPADHRYFSLTAAELTREFTPHLQKINPGFSQSQINKYWVWKTPFAQPVFTPGSAGKIPPLTTPVPGLYLAGMQQVYPWDRGVNYAVELGYKAANEIKRNC